MIIVHTGYNVTLTDDVLQSIREKFPAGYDLDIPTQHITAVHHAKHIIRRSTNPMKMQEAQDQEQVQLAEWFRSQSKKNTHAYLRAIYYQINVFHDKKDESIKRVEAIFVAHITIDAAHHYLNIFNNTNKRAIAVKADLSAHGEKYEMIEFDKAVVLPVVAYKKEQNQRVI